MAVTARVEPCGTTDDPGDDPEEREGHSMSFTQIIELDGVQDEQAVHDHLATWHAEQYGVAPGYQGCRVLADQEVPGRYLIEVDFSSEEEAKRNNARPETEAWAAKTRELAGSDPAHRDLRQVCTTYA